MVQKITILTIALSCLVAPIMGTTFRFQQKPPEPHFAKKTFSAVTIIGLAGVATCYRTLNLPRKKKRDKNTGKISYKDPKPSIIKYIAGAHTAALAVVVIRHYLGHYVSTYFAWRQWNNRSNQQVYYDARATYKNIIHYANIFHAAAEQPEHISSFMALACVDIRKDIAANLNTIQVPLKQHYEALMERLSSNTESLYKWDKLKQKMENEIARLTSTSAFFS